MVLSYCSCTKLKSTLILMLVVLLGASVLAHLFYSQTIVCKRVETLGAKQKEEIHNGMTKIIHQTQMPKIIHQTWKNASVPKHFVPWIKSWTKNNPDWEYWFWTDDSARDLISNRYEELLPMYDSYNLAINKADAMRYVILYEFGGIYADLDVESVKGIDPFVKNHSCFLTPEPFVHPALDSGEELLVINALMGCRPKHPLYQDLINELQFYKHMWHILDCCGPHYVTSIYKRFLAHTKHSASNTDEVYLAEPDYFMPTMDKNKLRRFRKNCAKLLPYREHTKGLKSNSMIILRQKACMDLEYRANQSKPFTFSYTIHHWTHSYAPDTQLKTNKLVDIHSIVPNVHIYKRAGA